MREEDEQLSHTTLALLTEVGGVDIKTPEADVFRVTLDAAAIEELVTLARRTDAEITFIEDARLLAPARHVGAMLRYRV